MNSFSTHSLKSGVSNTYTHSLVSSGVTTRSLERTLRNFAGKGHATFAVDLEMELAVEIYPMLGQLACPFGVGGGGHVFLSVLRFEGDLISFGVRFEIPLGRFPQHAYYPTMPHFATFSPTFALFSPHLSSSRYGRVTKGK